MSDKKSMFFNICVKTMITGFSCLGSSDNSSTIQHLLPSSIIFWISLILFVLLYITIFLLFVYFVFELISKVYIQVIRNYYLMHMKKMLFFDKVKRSNRWLERMVKRFLGSSLSLNPKIYTYYTLKTWLMKWF